MAQSDAAFRLGPAEFSKLLELTHELSNSVTVTVYLLTQIPPSLPGPLFDRLTSAMEMATRSRCALRTLMWELGEIQQSAKVPAPEQKTQTAQAVNL